MERWRAQRAQRAEQAQREEALPPARGRHVDIDFRFTHIHETELRTPPAAELALEANAVPAPTQPRVPTAAEAAEQAERCAAHGDTDTVLILL